MALFKKQTAERPDLARLPRHVAIIMDGQRPLG